MSTQVDLSSLDVLLIDSYRTTSLIAQVLSQAGVQVTTLSAANDESCASIGHLEEYDAVIAHDSGLAARHLDISEPGLRRLAIAGTPFLSVPCFWPGECLCEDDELYHHLRLADAGQASRQSSDTGGPVFITADYFHSTHALWAASCLLATLRNVAATGTGEIVEVTGFDSLVVLMGPLYCAHADGEEYDSAVGAMGRHPLYRAYQCSDGRWLCCGAIGELFERRALKALAFEDRYVEEHLGDNLEKILEPANISALQAKCAEEFASHTSAYWKSRLEGFGIPCALVRDYAEWFSTPEVTDNDYLDTQNREFENHTRSGHAPIVSKTYTVVNRRESAPPVPRAVDAGRHMAEGDGPLAGMRVAMYGSYIAAPYAGTLLASLGATVVKVEPVLGDGYRRSGYSVNRGMKSLAIDLKAPEGRDVAKKINQESDVVISALRPGAAETLGILPAANEAFDRANIIELSAYGRRGPNKRLPGFDLLIQAESGMMFLQGGTAGPVFNSIPLNDITGGLAVVFSALATSLSTQLTGATYRSHTSLAGAATYLLTAAGPANSSSSELMTGGPDFRGDDMLARYWQCSDGWIFIRFKNEKQYGEATDIISTRADLSNCVSTGQINSLSENLMATYCSEAINALSTAKIRAVRARSVREVQEEHYRGGSDYFRKQKADAGNDFYVPNRFCRVVGEDVTSDMGPPGIGEHSKKILESYGFGDKTIAQLSSSGVVKQGGEAEQVLPLPYR